MVKYLANFFAGAVLLLITGCIGISVLCNFSWALRVGGEAFFCVMSFICFFVNNQVTCIVLCIKLWNFSVGSLLNMLKLLAVRKECIFSEYLFVIIITIVICLCNCLIFCSQLLIQFLNHVQLSFL